MIKISNYNYFDNNKKVRKYPPPSSLNFSCYPAIKQAEGFDENGNFDFNPSSMNVTFPDCDILDTLENVIKAKMAISGIEDANKDKTNRVTAQVESELEILSKYPAHQMIKDTIDSATPQNPDVINHSSIKYTFNDIMDYYRNLGIEPEYERVSEDWADVDTYKFPDGTVVKYAEQYPARYGGTCSSLNVTTPLEDGRIAHSSLFTATQEEKDIEGQQYEKYNKDFAIVKTYDPKTACISDYDSNHELIKIYNPTDEQIAATYTPGVSHSDMYWQGDGVDKALDYSSQIRASKTTDETEDGVETHTLERFLDSYSKHSNINYDGRHTDSSVTHVIRDFTDSEDRRITTPTGADNDVTSEFFIQDSLIGKLLSNEQEKRANEIAGIVQQAVYHSNEISLGDYSEQIINQDDITGANISSTSKEQNGNKVAFKFAF